MLILSCQDFEISIMMYHFPISTLLCASYLFTTHTIGDLLNCCNPKIYTSAMAASLNKSEYGIN